jgi:phosphatidylinositol glycan class W
MLTAVGILGVDFKIFPRENAKTENFGLSAMDLGVGLYIVCHSMKLIRNSEFQQDDSILTNLKKFPYKFWSTLKSCSFLILIGLARLWSVKATNYVEHDTEYGVHWNFLFTIVLVKVICF